MTGIPNAGTARQQQACGQDSDGQQDAARFYSAQAARRGRSDGAAGIAQKKRSKQGKRRESGAVFHYDLISCRFRLKPEYRRPLF